METALNFLVQATKRGGRSVFFIRVVSLVDDEVIIGTLMAYVAENACPKVPLTAGSIILISSLGYPPAKPSLCCRTRFYADRQINP
jgi:hypothetical protein